MRRAAGLLVLSLALPAHGGHSLRRPSEEVIQLQERWVREAGRVGAAAVLMSVGQGAAPGAVPIEHLARFGRVLAVRDGDLPSVTLEPPDLPRLIYHRPFRRRGPDQIPLPGQAFLERWVVAGGAAVSTYGSDELFHFTADTEVPIGDVIQALAFVSATPERGLTAADGVVHLASLRGGRRQRAAAELQAAFQGGDLSVVPDRRPALELLTLDLAGSGASILVDEPLARSTVWAGGRAARGAFSGAVSQSLPATAAVLGNVVALGADRAAGVPSPLGRAGSPWNRTGWVRLAELLPSRTQLRRRRRIWIRLEGAPRDQVRGLAAWLGGTSSP